MIQEPIMMLLRDEIKGLTWSVDNRTASDNTGTVYYTGGSKPDIYEAEMRYPEYQVYIRSSDFTKASNTAQRVYDLLHRHAAFEVDVPIYESDRDDVPISYQKVVVYFIQALSDPIRVGVEDNVMEYSINFQADIRKLN